MPHFAHSDVLDNGPAYIKANADKMVAVLAYTVGDSYATVMSAGNIIAETAMTSADYTLSSSGNNRLLTVASGKTDTTANNTGDPTHIAYVDTVNSKVLWVCPETGAVNCSAGQPVTFPAPVYTTNQPV